MQTKSSPFEGWLVGCKAFAYINKHGRMKFDTRAAEGTFVAYDLRCTGYWINIGNGKVISQSVKFFEDDFQRQKSTKWCTQRGYNSVSRIL